MLTEIGTSPGVRILRRHLKEQSGKSLPKTPIGKQKSTPSNNKIISCLETSRKSSGQSHDSVSSSSEVLPQKSQDKTESESSSPAKDAPVNMEYKGHTLKSVKIAKKEDITKLHQIEEKKELKHQKSKEVISEFGVSKGLKPKPQIKKRKLPETEEKAQKRPKGEKKEGNEVKESVQKTKEKHKRLPIIGSKETGLPLPSLSGKANISSVFEYLMKNQQSTGDEGKLISQEVL